MPTLARRRLVVLGSLALAACGPATALTDAASHADTPLSANDATTPGSDAGADATAPTDAHTMVDTDASVPAPTPPAGFVQCGGASFSAMDVRTACGSTPSIPGALPYATRCDAATTNGGRYEVFCPPAGAGAAAYQYIWIEFDAVRAQGTTCTITLSDGFSAPLTEYPQVEGARFVASSGAAGASGDLSGGSDPFLASSPTDVVVQGDLNVDGTTGYAGTVTVWIALTDGTCPPGATGSSAPYYAMAVAAAWGVPDR